MALLGRYRPSPNIIPESESQTLGLLGLRNFADVGVLEGAYPDTDRRFEVQSSGLGQMTKKLEFL